MKKLYIKDADTNKKYLIKGFSVQQYVSGEYLETELFQKIYEILMEHNIENTELIDSKGNRVDLWK